MTQGRKGQFNATQTAHLESYLEDFKAQLDTGLSGIGLTRHKQSIATRALASSAFEGLDLSENSRKKWFEIIVRKYTNYYNNVWKKTNQPDEPSGASLITTNPLLKFASILSGRQTFAREKEETISTLAAQRRLDTNINEAAARQIVLKELWDALTPDEKSDWSAQAEEEATDVEFNQKEFSTNIHLALRSLCQGGLLGDAEMLLFYGFRDVNNGDLRVGSVHGHSKHNKINFGGNDLEENFGIPWSEFAGSVIPQPLLQMNTTAITVAEDGTVIFPSIDLEKIVVTDLRAILANYLQACWAHRSNQDETVVPWADIAADPAKFYSQAKFSLPVRLKDPLTMESIETMMLANFFINSTRSSAPFHFEAEADEPPRSPKSSAPPATPLTPPEHSRPASPVVAPPGSPPPSSPPPHVTVTPSPPPSPPKKKSNKRTRYALYSFAVAIY
ncbi:hypothetical protein R3P38DRAFT_2572266 [Favolaschia claudopus]|uniref:Uncharacterized protein n=1 Tax=Favolaschia claudopus TaxID=2862362 RepID=A0AAV9ZR05_9AGAR